MVSRSGLIHGSIYAAYSSAYIYGKIKKGQQTFIKRVISAVIVFFVIQIVQLVVSFISNRDENITRCFNCFVNGKIADNGCVSTSTNINGD